MNQYTKIAAGGVTVIVVIGALYWIYKRETKVPDFTPAPLPTQETTGVELTPQEAQDVRSLTNRLYEDLKGLSFAWIAGRDIEAWEELDAMNDYLFRAVFNDFGNLYYGQEGQTLAQWLDGENFWIGTSSWTVVGRIEAQMLKDRLLARFAEMNLN